MIEYNLINLPNETSKRLLKGAIYQEEYEYRYGKSPGPVCNQMVCLGNEWYILTEWKSQVFW